MFIDYEILKLIWWLFIGVLLAGYGRRNASAFHR